MVPEVSRCTVDIFSQILYDKTVDVGMLYGLFTTQKYLLMINQYQNVELVKKHTK